MRLLRRLLGDPSQEEAEAVAALEAVGGEASQARNGDVVAIFFIGAPVQDSDLALLKQLPNLQSATFFACPNISDDACTHLADNPALTSLTLKKTTVGDAGLSRLTRLDALRSLSIDGSEVSTEAVDQFRKLRSDVRITAS